MNDLASSPTAPSDRRAPRPARRLRWLLPVAAAFVSVGLVAAALSWLLYTAGGLAFLARALNTLAADHIQVHGVSGSLLGGFNVQAIHVQTEDTRVRIEVLRARLLDFGTVPPRLDFGELAAERVEVRVRPPATSSDGLPDDIGVPLVVTARQLNVGRIDLITGPERDVTRLSARAISAEARIGPDGYEVIDGRFDFGPHRSPLRATLKGRLDAAPPFGVDAAGTVTASVRSQPVRAGLTATGSLVALDLRTEVSGAGGAGAVAARIASFEPVELKRLSADLRRFDPSAWFADAPAALLDLNADLAPVDAPDFTLRGTLRVANAQPGPVDLNRIPASAASGNIELSAHRLRASGVSATVGAGRIEGDLEVGLGDGAAWSTTAVLRAVDLARVHSRARALVLDGQLRAQARAGTTAVTGQLRHAGTPAVRAELDVRATADQVTIQTATIELGAGRATVAGTLGLGADHALDLSGSLERFDPGLLVKGADARVSGRFTARGSLVPQPTGAVAFELVDSEWQGRPLSGQGRAEARAGNVFDVDAELKVRSARFVARGGLGAPDSVLTLTADVPSLAALALPLDGQLALEARLRGEPPVPQIDARLVARGLTFAQQRVGQVEAVMSYGGGTDGPLALQLDAGDHRFGRTRALSLQSASVGVEGRLADHTIQLYAANLDAEPLAVVARGGWRDAVWRGEVLRAVVGGAFDAQLLEAMPLQIEAERFSAGPARLQILGAQVEQMRVSSGPDGFRTSGRFSQLRPVGLAAAPANGKDGARVPLTLRGEWNLALAAQADGRLLVEREQGDLYTTATGDVLGLQVLRLQADVKANALAASAVLRGDGGVRLDSTLQAELERSTEAGWRVAPTRPLMFRTQAILPTMDWANAVLSERVRANVRLGGSLAANVLIDGTVAEPRAAGGITGTALRVAWIDQGARLDNGVLIARVEDDQIILDQLRFSGAVRTRPADARALQAAGLEPGHLSANGRLGLRDLSGVLQVAAERLPLMQRSDRWVMATGGANVVFGERRVQANAAAVAVAGFVDFGRTDLPTLPDDVLVVRADEAPVARVAEPRVVFDLDLGIGLGDAFYLRGLGLDTRAQGAVRVRSDGRGAIRATGAVEARDGTYQGFGQRLVIQRGRVNFQGPLENPGLDVLAVRSDLPVEVGVSITRTAQNPLIRLYSNPAMTDVETLSWLVLGRPADQGPADNIALARAAAGLLAGTGEDMPTQLARTFGIDEVTLRSGDIGDIGSILPRQTVAGATRGDARVPATVGGEIVVLGKRLSDSVSISYEQALSGATNAFLISYRLTQRLFLLGRAGSDNALSLVYSFAFD
jgi:translocation and assembly module TamB